MTVIHWHHCVCVSGRQLLYLALKSCMWAQTTELPFKLIPLCPPDSGLSVSVMMCLPVSLSVLHTHRSSSGAAGGIIDTQRAEAGGRLGGGWRIRKNQMWRRRKWFDGESQLVWMTNFKAVLFNWTPPPPNKKHTQTHTHIEHTTTSWTHRHTPVPLAWICSDRLLSAMQACHSSPHHIQRNNQQDLMSSFMDMHVCAKLQVQGS